MPHGCHIYETESYMAMETMRAYPPSQHAFPHWKYVFRCCDHFSCIDLTGQESDRHNYNTSHTIWFHVYDLIAHFKVHGRLQLDENKMCYLCLRHPASVPSEKLNTVKDLVMMETYIDDLHKKIYILAIHQLPFHLPHVRILGTH